ncbi:MAG: hypothetical protein GKS06_18350 [Acidobacteria bacterium]|nr:hypothetical protein [Acidobacteriota bacterium]
MLVAAISVLFLAGAIGMLVAAWLASPPTGPGFWRLSLLLIITGIGLGAGLRLVGLSTALPPMGALSLGLLAGSIVLLIAFGTALGNRPDAPRFALLGASAALALASLLTDPALVASQADGIALAIFVVGRLTLTAALGSVMLAMILAHWYLIQPTMPVEPLNRVLALFLIAEVIELVLVGAIITLHWPEWAAAPGGIMRAFVLGDALFVAVRLVLGVLAPLGLGWMTWKTVQIRSIQSATGILYAAIVFVLFGEIISLYLSLATGQPF